MYFRDRRELNDRAERALNNAAWDPKKLMLLYAGATAIVMLAVTVLNYLLQTGIQGTGGLSGMGLRSVLETAVQVLQLTVDLVVPFWTMGYVCCVLRMVRGQEFGPGTMLEGFRHFGPVLRLTLARSFYFLMIAMLCLYPSMMIFMWTPLAEPFNEIVAPFIETTAGGTEILLDDAALAAASEAMIPMLVIYVVLFVIVAAPRFYSYRMADFALMDDPQAGALAALRRSTLLMRGSRIQLLKLDISYWWFYLLDTALLALCYGDVLLSMLGITLPFDADTAYFLFYVLYLAAQLGLYLWARNKVECAYAAGYDRANGELEQKLQQMMTRMQDPQQ